MAESESAESDGSGGGGGDAAKAAAAEKKAKEEQRKGAEGGDSKFRKFTRKHLRKSRGAVPHGSEWLLHLHSPSLTPH